VNKKERGVQKSLITFPVRIPACNEINADSNGLKKNPNTKVMIPAYVPVLPSKVPIIKPMTKSQYKSLIPATAPEEGRVQLLSHLSPPSL
jgi:hypothetical protein